MSETLRRIWEKERTQVLLRGLTAQEREEIIKTVATIVSASIRQPKDGYTPRKGIDYFDGATPTEKQLLSLIKPLIPKVRDGETPSDERLRSLIEPLIPVVKDGETPSDEKLLHLIRQIMPKVKLPSKEDFIPMMTELIERAVEKLTPAIIKGILEKLPKQSLGGGGSGDFVGAGDGVSITTNAVGRKIISVSPPLIPVGLVNGLNATFTVTAEPKYVISDGATYFDGVGYVYTAPDTIVMSIPPSQYIRYVV